MGTRRGIEPVMAAPDVPQAHVINHQVGAEDSESKRNVLSESARIARSAVLPLSEIKASGDLSGLVVPGGFGAAKNLSTFGFKGAEMPVDPERERVLKEF